MHYQYPVPCVKFGRVLSYKAEDEYSDFFLCEEQS